MSLLRQIQDAAIDSSVDLPTLLRKCTVLAARLGSDDFKQWIEYELSGYPNKESLPDYRVLVVHSKGHFAGAFGSGLRNGDIPLSCLPEKLREMLGHSYLMQPVAALEALIKDNAKGVLQEAWNPDIVAHCGGKIYQDMNCLAAWKVIPSGGIVAAVDAVRTRVLNFVLQIEAQNPQAGEAQPNSSPVPMETVSQIFNTYITGNVQNLAPGSSNVGQTATYIEKQDNELFGKLLDVIKSASAEVEDIKSLSTAVAEMQVSYGTKTFQEKYQNFMSTLADHIQVFGPAVGPLLPPLAGMLSKTL